MSSLELDGRGVMDFSMPQRILLAIMLILFLTTTALAIRTYDTKEFSKPFNTFNIIMLIVVSIALLTHVMISVIEFTNN
jgi:hypothetical protein